jgi:hypothetical protein
MENHNGTKLKPAPLKYPNGGGLAAMATKPRASQKLEVEAMEAKHAAELAKLKEKHAAANKPAPVKAKANG